MHWIRQGCLELPKCVAWIWTESACVCRCECVWVGVSVGGWVWMWVGVRVRECKCEQERHQDRKEEHALSREGINVFECGHERYYLQVCVCIYVCVRVWERERWRDKQRQRDWVAKKSIALDQFNISSASLCSGSLSSSPGKILFFIWVFFWLLLLQTHFPLYWSIPWIAVAWEFAIKKIQRRVSASKWFPYSTAEKIGLLLMLDQCRWEHSCGQTKNWPI